MGVSKGVNNDIMSDLLGNTGVLLVIIGFLLLI